MEQLYEDMRRMELPSDLQTRILYYYAEMWDRHGTLNGETTQFVPELSHNLSTEVLVYQRMDMIIRAPFFHECGPEVIQEIVTKMSLEVYMPKDYIVVQGEIGDDMYFVQSGSCEITKSIKSSKLNSLQTIATTFEELEETVITRIEKGDYFGTSYKYY